MAKKMGQSKNMDNLDQFWSRELDDIDLKNISGGGLVDGVLGNTNLSVDVKLPAGIEISAELGPKAPPPK